MNKINFTAKDNFPLSSNAMEMMQQMIGLSANMALLGGTNYILSGCVDDGNGNISAGLVVINGEILLFEAGIKKAKITIQQTSKALTAFGVEYPEAYLYRTAKFSDTGEYNWYDFVQVLTNQQLQQRIASITGDIPGTVKMWAGMTSKIPTGYLLCDGKELQINDYIELWEVIGVSFGGDGQSSFKLPNLSGKFIVGFDNTDPDYNEISSNKAGGKKNVKLEIDQIPAHTHVYTDDINANQAYPEIEAGFPRVAAAKQGKTSAESSGTGTAYYSSKTGGNEEHENRPPYFVLAYIIKVK